MSVSTGTRVRDVDDVGALMEALRSAGFSGDLARDDASRAVYSTDNSVYHVPPRAVVFPQHREDVARVVRLVGEPRFRSLPIVARGGGTGTNGQSLTDGVVVDLSRHMNRILSINPVLRRARVEAGVVKDQLNAALRERGLFFAPELSTSNRATIGGMVNTDACGQGSCLYGKTRDHVLALTTVLADGSIWRSEPLDDAALREIKGRTDLVGEVHRVVDDVHRRDAAAFAERVPSLNRSVTGYDIAHVRDGRGRFDLNSVLCGSEGSLGLVVEVELNLLPIPARAVLLNLRYRDFDAALRDARELMGNSPAAIETVDSKVLGLARGDAVWETVAPFFPPDRGVGEFGVNIVEFVGEDDRSVEAQVDRAVASLAPRLASGAVLGYTIARDEGAVSAIWNMRKKAVGLLGNAPGRRRPISFVEDAAVPPERLADFIAAFRATLDRHGLDYGMFGHVDAGVLHVRPALDMTDPEDRALIRTVSDEIAALARAHGGVLWGEHGKGVRSEFAPPVFGPLYPGMQAIKAAFDPENRLNPGKVAAPATTGLLRVDGVPMRGEREARLPADLRAGYGNAFHCNGNGLCFTFDADEVMCPSYKGTRDRRHSPKGRAALLREWLVRDTPSTPRRGLVLGSAVMAWPRRVADTVRASRGTPDFAHEVKAAMDGCLSCKACVGQCPVKVNVPSFRASFLEAYHARYLRSPGSVLLAWVEHLLPLAASFRPVYNVAARSALGCRVLASLGVTALPPMPAVPLRRELARRGIRTATPEALSALSEGERARCVVLVVDPFVRHLEPSLLLDVLDLVAALGYAAWLAPDRPTGKALHVQGLLSRFRAVARRTAADLVALSATGVTLVGLDPAMTLVYRSEYREALGQAEAPEVKLLQEWLADACRAVVPGRGETAAYGLLAHCTEQATATAAVATWRDVFSAFGLDLRIVRAGCCGMAGTFGHETRHRDLSARIHDLSWREKVEEWAGTGRLLATGYSCRSQVKLLDGIALPHPAQVLLSEIGRSGPVAARSGPPQYGV